MASEILPQVDQMVKIAEALGVSVEYLMTGTRADRLHPDPNDLTDDKNRWIEAHQDLEDQLRKLPPKSLSSLEKFLQTLVRK